MSNPVQQSGIFTSLRRFLDTALEIAQVRLDLFGIEVELEKRRLFDGLLWGAIAVLVLGISLVLLCGFVILLFWDGYRLAAVGVMAFLFFAGGVILMSEARRRLRNAATMFSASSTELTRDRSELLASAPHEQR